MHEAIISLIFYSISNILLKKEKNGFNAITIRHIIAVSILLIIHLSNIQIPSIESIFYILLCGLIGATALTSLITGLSKHKTSIVIAFSSLSIVLTPILASAIFNEQIKINQYASIFVIFFGSIYLLKPEKEKKDLNSAVMYGLACSILGTMFNLITKKLSYQVGPTSLSVFNELSVMLFLVLFFMYKNRKIHVTKLSLLNGLSFAIAASFFYISVKSIGIGLTTIILSAGPLVTSILARIILNEKLSIKQYIALLIITFGLVLATI